MSEADTTTACPHCDSTRITRRSSSVQDKPRKSDLPWYCSDCQGDFETPTERERRGASKTYRGGSAKALVDADPEDYPK